MEKAISQLGEKEYKIWSKEITSDKITRCIEVKEVENGFVVIKRISGKKDNEYIYKERIYISQSNPLEKPKEQDTNMLDSALDAIDNLY